MAVVTVALARIHKRHRARWQHVGIDAARKHLELLLRQGYDGAFMVFSSERSPAFVQFRKAVGPQGDIALQMHFPRAPWSQAFYQDIPAVLKRLGLNYAREPVQGAPVVEFLFVDFGEDAGTAATTLEVLFTDVFGESALCVTVTGEGLCPFDEEIRDRRRYPAHEVLRRALRERARRDG